MAVIPGAQSSSAEGARDHPQGNAEQPENDVNGAVAAAQRGERLVLGFRELMILSSESIAHSVLAPAVISTGRWTEAIAHPAVRAEGRLEGFMKARRPAVFEFGGHTTSEQIGVNRESLSSNPSVSAPPPRTPPFTRMQ
jgi:hypothetical protein